MVYMSAFWRGVTANQKNIYIHCAKYVLFRVGMKMAYKVNAMLRFLSNGQFVYLFILYLFSRLIRILAMLM